MTETRCHRCDRLLFDCNERYVVSIRVSPDEISSESPFSDLQDPSACGFHTLQRSQADGAPDEEQDDMAFVVCRRCRVQWSANPMGLTQRPLRTSAYLH